MSRRYWEVDAIRGLALISMIIYHVAACMVMYHLVVEDEAFLSVYNTFWLTSGVFILVSGTALVLRHARRKGSESVYYLSIAKKAVFLFAIAMGITTVTWAADIFVLAGDSTFIKIGFLHMLSISMLLSIPFLRLEKWNIIPGLIVTLIGFLIIPLIQEPGWLYPLGIHGAEFMSTTQDYFPLFPWFGVMLLGIGVGSILYPKGVRRFTLPEPGMVGRFLAKIGNGNVTLIVYLIHVPIIFVIFAVIHLITDYGYF